MTRITTGGRLHFGLLRLPPSPDWADDGTRYYGGAGLMIDEPQTVAVVDRSPEWSATGPSSDRARRAARRFTAAVGSPDRFAIRMESAPPEHTGLGVGTQLELAVAAGITRTIGRTIDTLEIARVLGRGNRSGVGVHGFLNGGFMLDHGKRRPDEIARVERIAFPSHWRIVLLTPSEPSKWYGERETAAFDAIGARTDASMRSLLHDAIAPAIAGSDFNAFGTALREYNWAAGQIFATVQNHRIYSAETESWIEWLTHRHAAGTGQSSWGPTAFGFFEDPGEVAVIEKMAAADWPALQVGVTRARNQGASVD